MEQQPLYVFPEYLELYPSSEDEGWSLPGGADASTGANVGERFMVVDTRAHLSCYLVNQVIKSDLELFRNPRAEAEALEELARWAGCPPEAIAATVRTFFQRMRRAGLLRSAGADFQEESTWAFTAGQVLGEYRVGELIVEKPGVALHHARQVGTGMPVVLKVFILRGPRASRARKLFEREFSLMAGLVLHENVCRLLAFHPGEPCHAALEYAGGNPIHQAMAEADLSRPERVRIGAEALTHLHRHGFLHCPGEVWLRRGRWGSSAHCGANAAVRAQPAVDAVLSSLGTMGTNEHFRRKWLASRITTARLPSMIIHPPSPSNPLFAGRAP